MQQKLRMVLSLAALVALCFTAGCHRGGVDQNSGGNLQRFVFRAELGPYVKDVELRVASRTHSLLRPPAAGAPDVIPNLIPVEAQVLSIAWTDEETGQRYVRDDVRIAPAPPGVGEVEVALLIDENRQVKARRDPFGSNTFVSFDESWNLR